MTHSLEARLARATDIPAIAAIADATLFPGDMVREMIQPFLTDPTGDALWLVLVSSDDVVGFGFAEIEPMTDRTWNLRAIAVSPDAQGKGGGTQLLAGIERAVSDRDARMIVIDTTQLEDQRPGRRLYAKAGFTQIATLPDFWAAGEDKVTFVKPV